MKISKKIAGLATTAEASTMGKRFYLLNMTPGQLTNSDVPMPMATIPLGK